MNFRLDKGMIVKRYKNTDILVCKCARNGKATSVWNDKSQEYDK
jgi:hypothetical protein